MPAREFDRLAALASRHSYSTPGLVRRVLRLWLRKLDDPRT
jgi:hypothetical protein